MPSSSESYELLYFQTWVLSDVIRLMFELTNTPCTIVHPQPNWLAIKEEQRYGKMPRLTIKRDDGPGSVLQIWESLAIEFYLAERLGLLPQDLFLKADALSIISSLNELRDQVSSAPNAYALSLDERPRVYERHRIETIPMFLKYHEKLLAETEGVFYNGEKPLLPDLALLALYLRFRDMYDELNPINREAFPRLMAVVSKLLGNHRIAKYANEDRNQGDYGWVRKDMCYGPLNT